MFSDTESLVKFSAILALLSFIFVTTYIFRVHDLRGWAPTEPKSLTAVVAPTRTRDRGFTLTECLPGTVTPWTLPQAREYNGDATATVLSCRSRSSAMTLMLVYLLFSALGLVAHLGWKNRRSPP